MPRLILFNKPFDVLSQFSDQQGRQTLAHYLTSSECREFYPAGRLDRDSEGLLLLTDNGALQHQISHPNHKMPKTYWAQVEGAPSELALESLCKGVCLADGPTAPAQAQMMEAPPLWERDPPIRIRKNIPTHWLEITISEGRNRQVRRMTAAVGLPTLRLVRVQIGPWRLNNLLPGQYVFDSVHLPTAPARKRKFTVRERR